MKKIFIISLISLVVVLLFLGIYNFAFKKSTSDGSQSMAQFSPQMQQTKAQATAAPTNEKISAISNQWIVNATYDKKNDDILY